MAITHYLAMTAEEMSLAPLPPHPAWMACHFSPYSTGLTNLPTQLPQECLLILNDRTPIHGHDPERIYEELFEIMERYTCPGLLLDFQNPCIPEASALVNWLAKKMPGKLIVSQSFAPEDCIVLLPPPPTDVLLTDFLSPWKGRKIWLETSYEGQTITITKSGASFSPNPEVYSSPYEDGTLQCHYIIHNTENSVIFHTWRTAADVAKQLEAAEALGAAGAVGLYQEMRPSTPLSGAE